jgi:hypothetical protein
MIPSLRRSLAIVAAIALFAGAELLDGALGPLAPRYALLLAAAIVLVVLRQTDRPTGAVPRAVAPRRYWLYAGVLLVAATAAALGLTFPTLLTVPLGATQQLGLWVATGTAAVLAAHFCDRRRVRQPSLRFERRDWLIMLALFVAGTATRLWNLTETPPGLAYDEAWPFARTLQLLAQLNRPPFHVDDYAMSATYHYVSGASIVLFGWLGIDTLQAAKLPNVLFGGLAVAVLYGTVRLVASRRIAVTAALCLVWLTWPWILSRMHYSYSGDLLWIALATALVMGAFATDRMALAAAAAVAAALGVAWVKSAVLAAPWVLLLCTERVIAQRAWHPRRWAVPAACGVTLLLTVAPILSQLQAQPNFLWRYEDVLRQRAALLETAGLTSLDGYLGGARGAVHVLQVREAPLGRHVARLKFPALDPITSALATLGLCWAVWRWRRDWGSRVAVAGFVLFLWPAISSFPTEAAPAVSRRMIGSAFFVCWLAGYGADIVTRLTLPAARRLPAMLALGFGAIVLNAYYLRTDYDVRLYHLAEEMGVNRAAVIHAMREAAATGPVFVRLTRNTESVLAGTVDMPYVIGVDTVGNLKTQMRNYPNRLITIILPSDTLAEETDVSQWIAELSEVVPPSSWQFGATDPAGTPYYRRALVRVAPPPAAGIVPPAQ